MKFSSLSSGIILILIFLFSFCNQKTKTFQTKLASASISSSFLEIKNPSIDRGKYLAWHVMGCMDCHSIRDYKKFSAPVIAGTEGAGGDRFGPEFGLPGNIYAKNITPAALKSWTDEEIIRAVTRGISKNGDTLFPIMPYLSYASMSAEDLRDIISYIRTLKPIETQIPQRQLFIPLQAAIPPSLPSPDISKNVKPAKSNMVKYGEYLFKMASCTDCHTPRVNGQPDMARFCGGGSSFKTETFTVRAANITPDSSGIGLWTEKMFLQKFKGNSTEEHVNRDPGKFNSIMPWSLFGGMKDDDLRAIYAYLRTVKPVKGRIYPWD